MIALEQTPQGVVKMSEVIRDTVETSNNVGVIASKDDHILVSTHTRSFVDADMEKLAKEIAGYFAKAGADSETIMTAPAWQENTNSEFLGLTSQVFDDVLGWRPKQVAMHFVLEAGYFKRKYPGIEIACIGPRILEPHSKSERLQLDTVGDIWKVLVEMLSRLS